MEAFTQKSPTQIVQGDMCKSSATTKSSSDRMREQQDSHNTDDIETVQEGDDDDVQILEDIHPPNPCTTRHKWEQSCSKPPRIFIDDEDIEIIADYDANISAHKMDHEGSIPPSMFKVLKPHQVEGVEFMWGNVGPVKDPRGCILAHSMGLGKSLQAFFRNDFIICKCNLSSGCNSRAHFCAAAGVLSIDANFFMTSSPS